MSLQVVGAGLGRTGTTSLQAVLEHLLDAPCYHMWEVISNPDEAQFWLDAANGEETDWSTKLKDYRASVDWPSAAFWRELSTRFPESLILLSLRPAEDWWESARDTIYAPREMMPGPFGEMSQTLSRTRFPILPIIEDKAASMALFDKWNNAVLAEVPADRLLVWEAGDGWEPICQALDLPVPDLPFPHKNSRKEFIEQVLGESAD